ncbi:helix-turn-helix domain-containing protein [Thiofilum flexile]|uniref:helix-turn-helix domain-containing protein n=1 Tax=Thiofilum flexile TaxID=125627 RepID=UPI00035C6D2B|nr:helix-turn-helix domain-containing protein [Thiofilum flexile]
MMSQTRKTTIPNVGLYGEVNLKSQPEFVHIENIAARSLQYDWVIKPHRHGKLFQLLCLYQGGMEVYLDDKHLSLTGNWVVSIPPNCVHGFRFPIDTQGIVLTIVEPLLSVDEQQQLQPYFNSLLASPQAIEFAESSMLLMQLQQLFQSIERELSERVSGHTVMLGWLVKMVFMTLKRQLDYQQPFESEYENNSKQLGFKFRSLLDKHYRSQWSVQDYANALYVSPSTLNRLCTKHLGMTAKALIQNRLLLEIKRRLIYTTDSLDNIALTLGFKDSAYFSRFFKNLQGISPSLYRQEQYQATDTQWTSAKD